MGLMPGAGLNKEEVNYRQHEKCKTCMHFYYPGSCDIVDGNISAEAVCAKWGMLPKDNGGKDGEFYQEEYTRSKNE